MIASSRWMSQLDCHPSIIIWVVFNEAWGQFLTKEVGISVPGRSSPICPILQSILVSWVWFGQRVKCFGVTLSETFYSKIQNYLFSNCCLFKILVGSAMPNSVHKDTLWICFVLFRWPVRWWGEIQVGWLFLQVDGMTSRSIVHKKP